MQSSVRTMGYNPLTAEDKVIHFDVLFECKSSEERVVYKKLNSTETLIQRTTMEAPQQTYVLHRARRAQEDHQLLH